MGRKVVSNSSLARAGRGIRQKLSDIDSQISGAIRGLGAKDQTMTRAIAKPMGPTPKPKVSAIRPRLRRDK